MKKFIAFFLIFTSYYCQAQEVKNFDLIVLINNEIIREPLQISFILRNKNDSSEIVMTKGYLPGNLSLLQSDYEKIISSQSKDISMKFGYQTYLNTQPFFYTYEIPYKNFWLKDGYNILRIYNLDRTKYRKIFQPLSMDKNYTFELDSPSYTFIRIRKKY